MALSMTPQDVDATVRTVIGESSQNPDEMKSVAAVIRNRAANSGSSMSDVVRAPGQFEAWSNPGKLTSISPSDQRYQQALQLIAPVLRGDELGDFSADHFYAPGAQKALKRPAPSWDNGSGQDVGKSRFFTLGGNYGLNGAQNKAQAQAPAPQAQDEGSGQYVMRAGKLVPMSQEDDGSYDNVPAPPSAPSAAKPQSFDMDAWVNAFKQSRQQQASAQDKTPSADDIVRSAGMDPAKLKAPAGPKLPPLSPAQQAAARDWQAQEQQEDQNDAFIPPALKAWVDAHGNTFGFGLGPKLAAWGFRDRTNLHNFLASNFKIGKPLPYTGADAESVALPIDQQRLDQEAQAHPFATGLGDVTGIITSPGTKALASAAERATAGTLTKLAPKIAATRAGQIVPRLASVAAVGGGQAAGSGASHGDDLGQLAADTGEGALLSVPFGLAGEAVAPLSRIPKTPAAQKIAATAASVAAPAVVGAGLGYVTGGEGGAKTGAEMGAFGGLAAAAHATTARGAPRPSDYATALDLIAKAGRGDAGAANPTATAEQLESAPSQATTAEGLGVGGMDLAARAHEGFGGAQTPLQQIVAERQKPVALKARIDQHAENTLGEPISTAQQDFQDEQKALNEGPVSDAYSDALVGNGYWTPQIAGMLREPQIRTNMQRAATLLGDKAFVPNPDVKPSVYQFSGPPTWSMADYLRTGRISNPKAALPDMVPSDYLLDRTKRMLDSDVDRDDFGKVKKTSANEVTAQLSNRVRAMTGDLIPGLKEARGVAGEGLSSQMAYDNGFDLFDRGKSAETVTDFASRYSKLTPPEQDATRKGYLARMNSELEKTNFNPERFAKDPYHQALQDIMWGEKAGGFRAQLQREADLAASAKGIQSSARPTAPQGGESPALSGAVIGGADHGPSGVFQGGVSGHAISSAKRVADVLTGRQLTPRVQTALQTILPQPAPLTARQLRELHASRRPSPPKSGSLPDRLRIAAPVAAVVGARQFLKQNAGS